MSVPASCRLPDWFDRATLADQLGLILNCKQVDTAAILERDNRLADCRAWFKAEE